MNSLTIRRHEYRLHALARIRQRWFSCSSISGYTLHLMWLVHKIQQGLELSAILHVLKCHKLHPGRLTWNLLINHLERKMIFQASMIMFHVNLPGCIKGFQPMDAHNHPKPSILGKTSPLYKGVSYTPKLGHGCIPSRELTYPTLGKGKSSSKGIFDGICLFPEEYLMESWDDGMYKVEKVKST